MLSSSRRRIPRTFSSVLMPVRIVPPPAVATESLPALLLNPGDADPHLSAEPGQHAVQHDGDVFFFLPDCRQIEHHGVEGFGNLADDFLFPGGIDPGCHAENKAQPACQIRLADKIQQRFQRRVRQLQHMIQQHGGAGAEGEQPGGAIELVPALCPDLRAVQHAAVLLGKHIVHADAPGDRIGQRALFTADDHRQAGLRRLFRTLEDCGLLPAVMPADAGHVPLRAVIQPEARRCHGQLRSIVVKAEGYALFPVPGDRARLNAIVSHAEGAFDRYLALIDMLRFIMSTRLTTPAYNKDFRYRIHFIIE